MIGLDFHLMQQEDWTTRNYETSAYQGHSGC